MSVSEALAGSRARRIASLGPRAILIELGTPKGTLLCSVERGAQGLGWLDSPATRLALEPEPWLTTVRSLLEGAALRSFERVGVRSTRIELTRGDERLWLVLEWSREGALAIVRAMEHAPGDDAAAEAQVLLQVGRVHLDPANPVERYEPAESLDELRADGARLWARLVELELERRKNELAKRLRAELVRRKRRLLAVTQDAARAKDAHALRADAGLLLASLHALGKTRGEIELEDFTQDPPVRRRLTVDPKLGARAQSEAWFQRARKLERGALLAKERATATEREIAELQALIDRVAALQAVADLAPLAAEARRFGIAPRALPDARQAKPALRVPYREFQGTGARAIWVGRGAADNDALTLRHAKPHDLWLHVRDESGAHVVVPLSRNEDCPPELLCDAATLAAHFSGARGAERADVIYTPRRYVQKPRKSAVGAVNVLREKVFRLQLEPARLKRLLEHELAPDVSGQSPARR